MRPTMTTSLLAAVALLALGQVALAQGQQPSTEAKDRTYVGQMTEEQIRQKLAGEGFTEITEVKKIPVTRYRWTAKAVRAGKPMEVTVNELGLVSAK
jgi:hypothetical protein